MVVVNSKVGLQYELVLHLIESPMVQTPTIVGNWKMFKTQEQAQGFVQGLALRLLEAGTSGKRLPSVGLAVPFTAISAASSKACNSPIQIGAQNMHDADEGAYTGEISCAMLQEAGASFVLIGHSERRHLFGEGDAFLNKKMLQAHKRGMKVIFCVGESAQERKEGHLQDVLSRQITMGLHGIGEIDPAKLLIAYEPVWAIGTSEAATPDVAQEAHAFCRHVLQGMLGPIADKIAILYGGSVTGANVGSFLEQPDIQGVLVGGASLQVDKFWQIIEVALG